VREVNVDGGGSDEVYKQQTKVYGRNAEPARAMGTRLIRCEFCSVGVLASVDRW
jgi:hypothetical protein